MQAEAGGLDDQLLVAQTSFKVGDFERARSICLDCLKILESHHVCSTFTQCLFLVARSCAKLSGNEELETNLVAAEFHYCDENTCVLLHSLEPGGSVFNGSVESFESMQLRPAASSPWILPSTKGDVEDLAQNSPFVDREVLSFLCEICLNEGLSSSALNLALQIHSAARHGGHPVHTNSNGIDWVVTNSCESTLLTNYISVTHPPVGLSGELWARIVKLCSHCSPLIAVMHTDEENDPPDCCSPGENSSPRCRENKAESFCLETPHFVKVHEFSVKEQQLLAHSLALHEQQKENACEQQEEEEQQKRHVSLTDVRCTGATVQPVNKDYLAGVYDMAECTNRITAAGRTELDTPTEDDETTAAYQRVSTETEPTWTSSEDLCDESALAEPSPEDEQFFDSFTKEDDETLLIKQRRYSILRCTDRNTLSPDGEHNRSIRKRVRFSLGAAHPSPALEAEYGGRSNRRRLIDFARRRQLLANGSDGSDMLPTDNLYNVLFNTKYNPLFLLFRCTHYLLKLLLISLFHIRIQLFIWCSLLTCLFFVATLLVCGCWLNIPWSMLFPPPSLAQPWNSAEHSRSFTSKICTRYFVWLHTYWTQWAGS